MTKIMAILNATPDSFYEGSRSSTLEAAIARGLQITAEGADIIDIGGESTRPKNIYLNPSSDKPVTLQEELDRVIPLIQELKKLTPLPLSIDTMKPQVAAHAVNAGALWINDVTGFRHPEMRAVASSHPHIKLCVMHMQGTPDNMQINPHYDTNITDHIMHWFSDTLENLIQAGVKESQIILDPGIGFGKTVAHNLEIIHNLPQFKSLGFPLLLGVSRKQFMGKLLNNKPAKDLLAATLTMNMIAISSKVDYIRVHDVEAHRDMIDLLNGYGQTR